MITGIGIDIVDLSRIGAILHKQKDRFLKKIFDAQEIERGDVQEVGGKFAAKEAFVKALGTGFSDIHFRDILVLRDEQGKPFYSFRGELAGRIGRAAVKSHLSISHDRQYAAAVAVLETA